MSLSSSRRGKGASLPIAVGLAWVLSAVVALPSLGYPFGRDQGVYYYVAREWLRRGALPYRDSFDHKTPGVYVVHALAIAVFGEHTWAIRALELALVLALGWLAAGMVKTPPELRTPVRALTVLAAATLYYGHFGFWDTAQPEIGCALLALGAIAVASRPSPAGPRGAWMAAGAGALVGASLLMKPSALPLGLVAAWVCGRRRVLPFAIGAVVPPALAAMYFAAHGALRTLVEIVFTANMLYARNENVGGVSDAVTRVLDVTRQMAPTSLVLVYGTALGYARAWRRGDAQARAEYGLVLAMGLAVMAGVAMQLKFYTYHFLLLMAPAALTAALLARDALAMLRDRGWRPALAVHLATAHVVVLFGLSWVGEHIWFASARDGVLVALKRLPERDYLARFRIHEVRFDAAVNEDVARWLRDHAGPDDRLCDRAFEPELYAGTGLRCDDRFFWTPWIADVHRQYRREEWAAEDRDSLVRSPPRFVTVKVDAPQPINQEGYFLAMGYVRRTQIATFLVLERGAPGPHAER